MATQDKSNYFDQFDTPAPSGTTPGAGNPFDQNDNVPNKPKNSLGKTVRDVGVDIVGGLGDIGKQAYGLANFMTAGTLDPATRKLGAIASEAITPVMNYFTGQNVEATSAADAPSIAQGLARNDQAVSDLHSDYRKMREQERSAAIQNADGFLAETGAAVKETLGNPSLLLGDVVRSAPSMLAPAVVGRKVATTFGPEAAEQAAQRALAAGATREAAQAAGQEAVDKLATRTVIGVTGLGQVGGGANIDTVNALHGTSAAALAQNPEYHLLRQQGLSEVEARDELARKAGLTATAIAAPMSMAASKLTGAGEQLARVATGRYGAQGWRQLGIAMGKEAAQEYPESFGEQYGQGVGLQHYGDPNTDPTKGAFGAAAMGALAGGVMGAGEHVAGWALHRGQPQSEAATGGNAPTQEQPPPDSMPPAGPTVPPASPAGLAPDQGPGAPAAPVLPPDAGPLARAASLAPTAPPAAPAAAAQTMFPFSDRQGAQKLADRLSADTGRPYEVGDHPQQPGRFAALPVTLNMEEPAFLKHAKRLHLHPLTAQMAAGDDSGALFDAMRDYYPEITAQQWRKPQERAKMAALFLNHEVAQLGQLLGETPTPTQAYLARQVGLGRRRRFAQQLTQLRHFMVEEQRRHLGALLRLAPLLRRDFGVVVAHGVEQGAAVIARRHLRRERVQVQAFGVFQECRFLHVQRHRQRGKTARLLRVVAHLIRPTRIRTQAVSQLLRALPVGEREHGLRGGSRGGRGRRWRQAGRPCQRPRIGWQDRGGGRTRSLIRRKTCR